MSNEDVIDLGSSEDEKEPPPKKVKPMTNAMVHIPNPYAKLPGVTIKPIKEKTVKVNDKSLVKSKTGNSYLHQTYTNVTNINSNTKQGTNCIPIKVSSGICPQISITKTNSNKKLPVIRSTQGKKLLNKLPPSITVTKAISSSNLRQNPFHGYNKRKICINPFPKISATTVQFQDDEASTASVPQWYKRPEEDTENVLDINPSVENAFSMEEQNNREPAKNDFIEIVIEDSPIKLNQSKNEESNGDTIMIDESPAKSRSGQQEVINQTYKCSDKQSKKKLNYQTEENFMRDAHSDKVEIEIDMNTENKHLEHEDNRKESKDSISIENDSIHNSLSKKDSSNINSFCSDVQSKTTEAVNMMKEEEFNEVYQKFIDTCFHLENSDDMKKIVEKKIKAYYRQCSDDYVNSEEFKDFVSGKITAIESSPGDMYFYIQDVVDELNMQRKLHKANNNKLMDTVVEENDHSNKDTKRQKQIRKLEKTLKKLHRAIMKLENQEVDFDDEEDSVYLLTERYKERLIKVHAKICQLTNTKMPSEPHIKLETRPGRPTGPAQRLEKFINKKVPIGAPLPFPDFHDVLQCVREANKDDKLGWTEMEIDEEARALFVSCGKKLQRRRRENDWRIMASRVPTIKDPAEENESLKKTLETNKISAKQESEIFNKYVDRQIQLKLEGEEIGENEADESPSETEEEDDEESSNILECEEKNNMQNKLEQEEPKLDSKGTEEKNVEVSDEKIVKGQADSEGKNLENVASELHTISDNSDEKVDSDIDELHLLQKIYSEAEASSSSVELTSGSAISLSDTDEDDEMLTNDVSSTGNKNDSDIDELEMCSENEVGLSVVESTEEYLISNSDADDDENQENAGTHDVSVVENTICSETEIAVEAMDICNDNNEKGDHVQDLMPDNTTNVKLTKNDTEDIEIVSENDFDKSKMNQLSTKIFAEGERNSINCNVDEKCTSRKENTTISLTDGV